MKLSQLAGVGLQRLLTRPRSHWDRWQIFCRPYDPFAGMSDWLLSQSLSPVARQALSEWFRPSATRHAHNTIWAYDIHDDVRLTPAGWVVDRSRRILEASRAYYNLAPPVYDRDMLAACGSARKWPLIAAALSLRDPNEGNYWHFWDDQLPKLWLAEELGMPRNLPVVVGPKLANSRFFIEARARGVFGTRDVITQTGPLRFNRLVVVNAGGMQFEHVCKTRSVVAPPTPDVDRHIFVTRSGNGPRALANIDEIRPVIGRHGFTLVDCDAISFDEQVAIFASATAVVGVHGAALANLFWCNPGTEVVEIFHPEYVNPHYAWLAKSSGWRYSAITGSVSQSRFEVGPEVLETLLASLNATRHDDGTIPEAHASRRDPPLPSRNERSSS